MATIKIEGMTEYQRAVIGIGKMADEICKRAVYDGAKIAIDAVRRNLNSLVPMSDEEAIKVARSGEIGTLSEKQKAGLTATLGLAPIRNKDGTIGTKIGFSGYNRVHSEKYPKGQPNVMIAASIENGSSVRRRQPFIRPAANRVKAAVKAAMEETFSSEINNLMEGK